jgi:hypothetical protein
MNSHNKNEKKFKAQVETCFATNIGGISKLI